MPHCHTFIETLRRRGYRVTPQREMVIEIIAHSGCHMTVEEIFEEVQAHSRAVNIATIYRTLDLLVEEGLASRADLGSGRVVYATIKHGPHAHLVCRRCGYVVDVEIDLFEPWLQRIQAQCGFVCGSPHFVVHGLCAGCQAEMQDSENDAEISKKEI
jgi:Fur family ferric uptake transcriptional regulator